MLGWGENGVLCRAPGTGARAAGCRRGWSLVCQWRRRCRGALRPPPRRGEERAGPSPWCARPANSSPGGRGGPSRSKRTTRASPGPPRSSAASPPTRPPPRPCTGRCATGSTPRPRRRATRPTRGRASGWQHNGAGGPCWWRSRPGSGRNAGRRPRCRGRCVRGRRRPKRRGFRRRGAHGRWGGRRRRGWLACHLLGWWRWPGCSS
mmetsp:Transcript_34378/g.75200  ORF Transcript_34378/g.75200 Transcript_34378/m.75200 type:complete len:206 (+) Transcript_34378:930-1547(+)